MEDYKNVRINVKKDLLKCIEKIKKAKGEVSTMGNGIIPPTVDNLLAEGFTLAEALAIIAQWYIDHPEYEP